VLFEHVSGVPLKALLATCGGLSIDRFVCRRVMRDVVEACLALHTQSTYTLLSATGAAGMPAFVPPIGTDNLLVCDRGLRCVVDQVKWGESMRQSDPAWAKAVKKRER